MYYLFLCPHTWILAIQEKQKVNSRDSALRERCMKTNWTWVINKLLILNNYYGYVEVFPQVERPQCRYDVTSFWFSFCIKESTQKRIQNSEILWSGTWASQQNLSMFQRLKSWSVFKPRLSNLKIIMVTSWDLRLLYTIFLSTFIPADKIFIWCYYFLLHLCMLSG